MDDLGAVTDVMYVVEPNSSVGILLPPVSW